MPDYGAADVFTGRHISCYKMVQFECLSTCCDAPNCMWTDPVSTVPTTAGIYLIFFSNSSVSKTMGMLPPCNLRAAIFVVIQYSEYL